MAKPATVLTSRVLHQSGRRRYLLAVVRTATGHELERMIDDHGDAVAVLPYDPARRVAALTRQERAPPLIAGAPAPFLEALAGLVDEGEGAEAAARREADEETGLELDTLEFVGRLWSSAGVSTERMSLYLAPYDEDARQGEGGGLASEHEEIEVVELPLADLATMADAGEIVDMKTLALVQTLRLRRPELFSVS